MERKDVPSWVLALDKEALEFIRKFIVNSGSLKSMANDYGVSYPTVRTMLDRLIQKIEMNSKEENVEFVNMIKNLVIDERLSLETAKIIIEKYRTDKGE